MNDKDEGVKRFNETQVPVNKLRFETYHNGFTLPVSTKGGQDITYKTTPPTEWTVMLHHPDIREGFMVRNFPSPSARKEFINELKRQHEILPASTPLYTCDYCGNVFVKRTMCPARLGRPCEQDAPPSGELTHRELWFYNRGKALEDGAWDSIEWLTENAPEAPPIVELTRRELWQASYMFNHPDDMNYEDCLDCMISDLDAAPPSSDVELAGAKRIINFQRNEIAKSREVIANLKAIVELSERDSVIYLINDAISVFDSEPKGIEALEYVRETIAAYHRNSPPSVEVE